MAYTICDIVPAVLAISTNQIAQVLKGFAGGSIRPFDTLVPNKVESNANCLIWKLSEMGTSASHPCTQGAGIPMFRANLRFDRAGNSTINRVM